MDALSHAMIGLTVAGLSGQPLSFHDPIYLATLLGSQAPDFDIIAQMRGSFSYIRQHRAISHSIPGIAMWSILIACSIQLFNPEAHFFTSLLWAFAGSLSHILIDYFNTHGTALLWPFRIERKSCRLLNVFDPILFCIMLGSCLLPFSAFIRSMATLIALFTYILLRIYLRQRAKLWLQSHFDEPALIRLCIMPSLKRLLYWDFVIETVDNYIVGQIGALYPVIEISKSLPKNESNSYAAIEAQKTTVGDFFISFSPLIYYEEIYDNHLLKVNIYDLRYLINQQFRHSATIIFDKDYIPIDSYMLSYGRKIRIPC